MNETPHEQRRGWLRNGNAAGDFLKAPRCGAKTRRGTKCECPAMKNGRCRLHGGLSTGVRTVEGLDRIRRANYKHGRRSGHWTPVRARHKKTVMTLRDLIKAAKA